MLEGLGVSEAEERVYRILLTKAPLSISDIAARDGLGAAAGRRAVAALEGMGLVVRSTEHAPRFSPAPPDLAIRSLAYRRREEIDSASMKAMTLIEELYEPTSPDAGDVVQVIPGEKAVMHHMLQIVSQAEREVLVFSRPPYPLRDNKAERDGLARGVKYRFIYDHAALDERAHLKQIEDAVLLGEQARVLPQLPMKLTIADGRIGLVSVSIRGSDLKSALIVHPSSLLDALIMLFEVLWREAVPLQAADAEPSTTEGERDKVPDEHAILVSLLAAGLKDEVIARNLGVTPRTFRRRLRALLDGLGARTRFQAGLQTAWRGWIPKP